MRSVAMILAAWAMAGESKRDVILFLGDSLTAGYGIAQEEAYPALLAERWSKEGLPFRVRNAGVSGMTTAGILENLDWNLAQDVHTVFLAVGSNDGLRGFPIRQARRNISSFIEAARKRGIRVVLAGMKIPPNYGEAYARAFENMYPQIAKKYKLQLLPFILEGVAGKPEMNIKDGIHPNTQGHQVMAGLVDRFFRTKALFQ